MGALFGVLALFAMLAIIALVVLASIAAVVEILPPPGSRDADDLGAGQLLFSRPEKKRSQRRPVYGYSSEQVRRPRQFTHP